MYPKVIGIIPARYGSTRFPGKPLQSILGKSLIERTYENAKRFREFKDVVVATDDPRIFAHVQGFGGKVVMTSHECTTGTDRIAEVVRTYPEYENADFIFNVQGDEPCLSPKVVSATIAALIEDPSASVSTAAVRLWSQDEALNPNIVKCVIDLKGNALYFSRSLVPHNRDGSFDPVACAYYQHIGVYCFTPDFLLQYEELATTPLQDLEKLEQLKILEHGFRIKVALCPDKMKNVGVDTIEDVKRVEELLTVGDV